MKKLLLIAACLLAPAQAFAAEGTLLIAEQAYEITHLRIVQSDEGRRILASRCDGCPQDTLEITPETRLFHDGREVPLERIGQFRGRQAVVFRRTDSMHVTRILVD